MIEHQGDCVVVVVVGEVLGKSLVASGEFMSI